MSKCLKLIFVFCFVLTGLLTNGKTFAGVLEGYVTDNYSISQWLDAGAKTSYDKSNKEILIKKDMQEPAWGGAILEIGTIDLLKENYLKFNVTELKGLYAIIVHYGGKAQYETHKVKIQEDTTIKGVQEYNISEALRMEGLTGIEQVAIQILVVDPQGKSGQAMLRLQDMSFATK